MIAKIESMTESWQKPWIFGQGGLPYNIVSGRNYTGTNILTLLILTEVKGYQSPVFVTFEQAKELGLQVRKGSKLFPVVFWKPFYLAITSMLVQIKEFMALYKLVNIKMRMLRIPELKRIMGFPENYVLIGTQGEQKKFIGNAVEVNMARVFCEALVRKLYELNITPREIAA